MTICWNKFSIAKMSSSFGPRVSQCGFLIKVLSCMIFQKNYFSHFCAINAEFQEDFNHCGFSKAAFLKTVVYYKQDFFRQINLPPVQELEPLPSRFSTTFYSRIFLVGETSSPPIFWLLWIFFVEIYTIFSAAFNCPLFLIHEKITGYLFWAKSSLP